MTTWRQRWPVKLLSLGRGWLLGSWNEIRGFADMGGLLYPQLQDIDCRADVPRLDVPAYVMQGRHEPTARARFADEWLARLQARLKRRYDFVQSGHRGMSCARAAGV